MEARKRKQAKQQKKLESSFERDQENHRPSTGPNQMTSSLQPRNLPADSRRQSWTGTQSRRGSHGAY